MPSVQRNPDRDLVRTFSAISAALNLKQPLATTLDLIAEQVARTLGHRFCAIALHDEHQGTFSIRGSYGLSRQYLDAANQYLREQIERDGIARAQSVTVGAFRTRMPIRIYDIATDPTFEEWRKLAELVGYSSAVFLPLVFRDEPIGTLSCYDVARTYTAEDVDALRPVAEQTATAVGIARLLARQQDAIETLKQTTREVDERNATLRETADTTRTLTDLLLRHCSLNELVTELHHRLDRPVTLYDDQMRALATSTPDSLPVGDAEDIVVPVEGADVTYGHLVVSGSVDGWPEARKSLLEPAAMACALYFMREQAASERQLRVASQMLHDLLNRDAPSADLASLAKRLHLDGSLEHRIITVTPLTSAGTDTTASRRSMHAITTALRRLGETRGVRRPAAQAPLGPYVVAVIPGTSRPEDLVHAVRESLKEAADGENHQVGVSRICRQPSDFRHRYQELRKCQHLAGQAADPTHTVIADHWHVHTMLMRTAEDDDIRGRAHELLDPVMADPGAARLLESVRVYLDNGTNLVRTAGALSVHPNTVKYRLRKLERLSTLTVDRMQDLIELQLALTVYDLDPARFHAETHTATLERDASRSATPQPLR